VKQCLQTTETGLPPASTQHPNSKPPSSATMQPQSTVVAFLRQPFTSWQSTLLYICLCSILLAITIYIAKKYIDLLRCRSRQTRISRPSYNLPTSQHVYPRTPYPSSPLVNVTSASDDSSDEALETKDKVTKTRIPRKPARNWVTVGSVDESHIAKRRRL
jgi:hypothetical protein